MHAGKLKLEFEYRNSYFFGVTACVSSTLPPTLSILPSFGHTQWWYSRRSSKQQKKKSRPLRQDGPFGIFNLIRLFVFFPCNSYLAAAGPSGSLCPSAPFRFLFHPYTLFFLHIHFLGDPNGALQVDFNASPVLRIIVSFPPDVQFLRGGRADIQPITALFCPRWPAFYTGRLEQRLPSSLPTAAPDS